MSVVEPLVIYDAGFQLTVLATFGLPLLVPPIQRALAAPFRALPGAVVVAELLSVTITAQLATLPVLAVTFHQVSLIAPIANLLTVPLLAPLLIVGAALLFWDSQQRWGSPSFWARRWRLAGSRGHCSGIWIAPSNYAPFCHSPRSPLAIFPRWPSSPITPRSLWPSGAFPRSYAVCASTRKRRQKAPGRLTLSSKFRTKLDTYASESECWRRSRSSPRWPRRARLCLR
jgi:predicted membrane metal-binding protein